MLCILTSQMGALHAFCWLKPYFLATGKTQKAKKEKTYQHLGAALKHWGTPKFWFTPVENIEN